LCNAFIFGIHVGQYHSPIAGADAVRLPLKAIPPLASVITTHHLMSGFGTTRAIDLWMWMLDVAVGSLMVYRLIDVILGYPPRITEFTAGSVSTSVLPDDEHQEHDGESTMGNNIQSTNNGARWKVHIVLTLLSTT
jgi:hypothetical protein